MPERLGVCDALLSFERGVDECLLVNAFLPDPLYIRRGREHVTKLIRAVGELGTPERVLEQFPREQTLLQLLIDHQIVCTAGHPAGGMSPGITCRGRDPAGENRPRCGASGQGKARISLYLLLSQSCNPSCIYCLNGQQTYRREKQLRMTEQVALVAVESCLTELSPGGELEIVFFGGEPLLNWPLAKEVIAHCEQFFRSQYPDKQFRYHVTSNLSLFPSDLTEWAQRHKISFLCDVDGPARLHNITRPYRSGKGSHTDIVRNIGRLRNVNIPVALRSTVTSHNVDYIPEIAAHHKELDGAGSAFVAVNPVTSDRDILPLSMLPEPGRFVDKLLEVYEQGIWSAEDLFPMNSYIERVKGNERMLHGCGAPYGNTPVVDVDGNVYACIYLVGIDRFHVGNILDGTYPEQALLDDMLRILNVDMMESCKDCSWRYFCGGGCPVGKLTVAGNPSASQEVVQYTQEIACKTTKAIVEALFWRYADETAGRTEKEAQQLQMPG